MRLSARTILVLSFILAFTTTAGPATLAQEDLSAVQVDMSVLNAMDPASGDSGASYQTKPHSRPSLTNQYQRQRISKPPPPAAYEESLPVREPVRESTGSGFVRFPVTVKERNDTFDPSLGKSHNGSVNNDVPAVSSKSAVNAPIPALKPVESAPRKKTVNIPVPKKRPGIADVSDSATPQGIKVSDLSKGGMAMPAVPARKVEEEILSPPPAPAPVPARFSKKLSKKFSNKGAPDDALAKNLVMPDREAMVRSIQAVSKLADALTPPSPKTKIVYATPMRRKIPVPAQKPVIPAHITASAEEAIDITEIEPAAGTKIASLADMTESKARRVPRLPPEGNHELEYITLPFQAGSTKLDEEILHSLNDQVLELLKNNPDWRLQIQAFASKTSNQIGDARRLSLSRALAIRSYLLEHGIEGRRMDVRALGMQTDRAPVDRVDFVFFNPAT